MRRCLVATIVALGLSQAGIASAQTTQDNLDKYWSLRKRILAEFTIVGDGPGKSQPADERRDSQGYIRWADSTIRLGWYIGVLASEYYLVTHASTFPKADGGDSARAQKTADELFYALRAMERLDEVADASFPSPCTQTPAINGFFIRDDVPADFYQNFPPLTETRSDFVDPALTNKEMSQDQVYHVLIGLALTKALVPASVSSQGKVLHDYAVEQAKRIIVHVSDHNWVITNPACGDRNVARGPLASGFSGGTRQAIGFITDGAYVPDTAESLLGVWDGAKSPNYAPYFDIDSLHMAMAIAAVGDGWGNETADALATLAAKEDWPLYPLLHRALHGDAASGWCTTGASINQSAKKMLDELPKGAEPASPQPGTAVYGFTRSNRFLRGKAEAYTGEQGSEGLRFNGLDYMLLHNLYAIATPATWQGGDGPGIPECKADGGSTNKANSTDDSSSGCGCRTSRRQPVAIWLLGLGFVLGISLRASSRSERRQR